MSTRLPGKVLMPMPFPDGPPMLLRIVESLKKVEIFDRIIIATSVNQENDALEFFGQKNNIEVYRGDEEDVQSRFIDLIEEYGFDDVVRLTGDNPIVDPKYLNKAIQSHITGNYDYTKTKGLPLGTNFEIVKASTLLERKEVDRSDAEMEHVTYFLRQDSKYKVNYLDFGLNKENIRLTVDYPNDYAVLCLLLSANLEYTNSIDQLLYILEKNNWISDINGDRAQIVV